MTPSKIRQLIRDSREQSGLDSQLADALEHLLQYVEWMPAKDAPTGDGDVLVFGGRHERITQIKADGEWWGLQRGLVGAVPTHFLPLPPPPETEVESS